MNIIFCMAGLYSRFRDKGYTTPKYLLQWEENKILDHILEGLGVAYHFDNVFFLANKRDEAFRSEIVDSIMRFDIPDHYLIFIEDTCGQAETALIGVDMLLNDAERSKPVLFHNIDTVLRGRDIASVRRVLSNNDGYIDVFQSSSPDFSYVDIDAHGLVIEIREKVVISSLASTGLYGFRSARSFMEWYSMTSFPKEPYISDIYTTMIASCCKIRVNSFVDSNETIVLGTPAQYEALVEKAKIIPR